MFYVSAKLEGAIFMGRSAKRERADRQEGGAALQRKRGGGVASSQEGRA